MQMRAKNQDAGKWFFLVLTIGAAFMGLFATIAEMHKIKDLPVALQVLHGTLGVATILFSWLVAHVAFALHYAHTYYGEHETKEAGGLDFPGKAAPDYWDFLYFSFVIGMTSQVSDIPITRREMRHLALVT